MSQKNNVPQDMAASRWNTDLGAPEWVVTNRDLIRDASGDYGCPACWAYSMSRLQRGASECPICHARLVWS